MKKKYIIPACKVVCLRSSALLQNASPQNEYSNNQGHIRFNKNVVRAEDGD